MQTSTCTEELRCLILDSCATLSSGIHDKALTTNLHTSRLLVCAVCCSDRWGYTYTIVGRCHASACMNSLGSYDVSQALGGAHSCCRVVASRLLLRSKS